MMWIAEPEQVQPTIEQTVLGTAYLVVAGQRLVGVYLTHSAALWGARAEYRRQAILAGAPNRVMYAAR